MYYHITIKVKRVRNVFLPKKANDTDAGIDFFVPRDIGWESTEVLPNQQLLVPSGIKAEIPKGYALVAFNKSGIAKSGLVVGACVVDSGYEGEIHLNVWNLTTKPVSVKAGQKLVQFLLLPVPSVSIIESEELETGSTRGSGGFGSTNT